MYLVLLGLRMESAPMGWIIPGRSAASNSILKVAANSFLEKAAFHHLITLNYGIPMAIRVEVDCSSPSGMTSPLTTLHPPALIDRVALA